MVKSLKLHVFYKVAVNSELANTEWLLWEETQGKFLRVSGPNILVNWSVHNHVLCALLLKDTLFNMYCWSINIELTVNSTITHAKWSFSSVQSLSPVRLFVTAMNHSTPGRPVHHQLPEFTQTHVHQLGDAIQPSHPLSSSLPPAPNPSQHQGLFQWVNSSHEVVKVLEFQPQHQSFQWTPRTGLL